MGAIVFGTPQGLWDDGCVISPTAVNPSGPDGSMTLITSPTGYLGCLQANFRVVRLRGASFAWTGLSAGDMTLQPADGADQSGLVTWSLANSTYSFGVSDLIIFLVRRSGLTTGSVAVASIDLHIQKGPFGTVSEGGPT